MNLRPLAALAVAALTIPTLAGCASAAGIESAPTVTVTATVTAEPTPTAVPRAPEDPLTELDAWLLCWGATSGANGEDSTLFGYAAESPSGSATVTDNGDGTFEVLVPFAPSSGEGFGAESICVAGGTVGDPTVELRGGRDFG